ncbi:MAG: HlyD family efflux transporter periplasmic adaptor subunit [Roseiarcus sp.]|jgi:HlyD family secretion protein
MDRRIVVLFGVAVALGALWWVFLRPGPPGPEAWQGYADADFVKVGPTQQGLVTAVRVERGDRVVKGAPLFEQDDADDRYAVDQAARLLQQTRDQLANLQNPAKPTEIAQAEANLRDAVAARDKVLADLQRNQALLKTGAATAQLVDEEQADLRSATAKIAADEAALEQAKAPLGRPGEIIAQTSAVNAAEAALAMARWRLAQRSVVSPVTGVVADVLARAGETLDAGAPVVSLLPPENIFIRFFVPEPSLAHVHVGDAVALLCDSCPAEMTGTVSYIAPQAEYTPPFIYSETTRSKFVFLAEARPEPAEATLFNPGQPVTVRPRTPPP